MESAFRLGSCPRFTVAGIEPGLHGGLALLLPDGRIRLHEAPVKRYRSGRREYHTGKMYDLLTAEPIGLAVIEVNELRPEQAADNLFGVGLWIGMTAALRIRSVWVTPERWQESILRARGPGQAGALDYFERRFPRSTRLRRRGSRSPSEGAVVAACLTEFGRRHLETEEYLKTLEGT